MAIYNPFQKIKEGQVETKQEEKLVTNVVTEELGAPEVKLAEVPDSVIEEESSVSNAVEVTQPSQTKEVYVVKRGNKKFRVSAFSLSEAEGKVDMLLNIKPAEDQTKEQEEASVEAAVVNNVNSESVPENTSTPIQESIQESASEEHVQNLNNSSNTSEEDIFDKKTSGSSEITISNILYDVTQEIRRILTEAHPDCFTQDYCRWGNVLSEECGEIIHEINDNLEGKTSKNMYVECVQLASASILLAKKFAVDNSSLFKDE